MESDQKRAFLAVILSGVVLFGWQHFFAPQVEESTVIDQPTEVRTSNTFRSAEHKVPVEQKRDRQQGLPLEVIRLSSSDVEAVFSTNLTGFNIKKSLIPISSAELLGHDDKEGFSIDLLDNDGNVVNLTPVL